mgnify:CR=1 FL=1
MDCLSAELRQQDLQTRVMSDRVCRGYRSRSSSRTQEAIRKAEIDLKLKIAIREAIEEEKKRKEKK